MTRRNPRIGHHRDMVEGGYTDIVRPLEEMSAEEILALPRDAFSKDEWAQLDEDTQEEIYQGDPDSQRRVQKLAAQLVSAWEYAATPETEYAREVVEDSFELFLSERSDDIDENPSIEDEVAAVLEDYSALPEDEVRRVLRQALVNNNNYDYVVGDAGTGEDAIYVEPLSHQQMYIDSHELGYYLSGMKPDEIRRAIELFEELAEQTELDADVPDLDVEQLRKAARGYGLDETVFDTNKAVYVVPRWDDIRYDMEEDLGEPVDLPPFVPPEGRVFMAFDDGYVVVELLPQELAEEGRAMRMCVGDPKMGYVQALARGEIMILSLRRPNGKPKLTFEVEMGRDGPVAVEQIKGKANRLPGWDLGHAGSGAMKEGEVEKAVAVVEELGLDPLEVEDLEPALEYLTAGERQNPGRRSHCARCAGAGGASGFCTPYQRKTR